MTQFYNFKKKFSLALIIFLMGTMTISAQSTWDAGGDGTSWQDAANWNPDGIPAAGSLVIIKKDVTLTGTMTNAPKRIKVQGKKTVTFALDMTVGGTDSPDHAISIGKKCHVIFGKDGSAFVFNLTTANNKQGIASFAGADSSSIVVMPESIMSFSGSQTAVTVGAPHTTFENKGVLRFDNTVGTGIKVGGLFENKGTISAISVLTDAIAVKGGTFTNTTDGIISAEKATDDGIEVADAGTFINEGTISIVSQDLANSKKNALAIGNDTLATFINKASGIIDIDAGLSDSTRAVVVASLGSLENSGIISLSGDATKIKLYSKNSVVNHKDGVIDLGDGKAKVIVGSLLNEGLMTSTLDSALVVADTSAASVTNKAYYNFGGVATFGTNNQTDLGLGLDADGKVTIDAAGSCTVDLAETAYEYFVGGVSLGSSAADGTFTFPNNSITSSTAELTTTLPNVLVVVTNVCDDAVNPDGIHAVASDYFKLYPTLVEEGQNLNLEFQNKAYSAKATITDMNGRIVQTVPFTSGATHAIDVAKLQKGQYFIILTIDNQRMAQSFIKL